MNLVEIEHQINEVLASYDDTLEGLEGADKDAFIEDFQCIIDQLGQAEADKIDAYGYLLSRYDAESDRLKTIIGQLQDRKAGVDGRSKRMRDHILNVMDFTGRKKIEGGIFIARLYNGESVDIVSETMLPGEYVKTEVVTTPDKNAIKEAIKAGKKVPGATIRTSTSVSLKAR